MIILVFSKKGACLLKKDAYLYLIYLSLDHHLMIRDAVMEAPQCSKYTFRDENGSASIWLKVMTTE